MKQESISKSDRILITGASGLVGHEVISQLIQSGYRNLELLSRSISQNPISEQDNITIQYTNADIREIYPLSDAIERADVVIHAAASVSFNPKDFPSMKEINIDGTENIVNLCLHHSVKKLIHISSVSVFGSFSKNKVISENMQGAHDSNKYFYGYTKYEAEQHVWRGYHEGLDILILNPSLILGQGDYSKSSLQLFEKVYKGLPYYPKGGNAIVDIEDVGKAVINGLDSDISGERIIISAGNISYKDLFQKLAKGMNRKGPQKLVPSYLTSILWRIESVRSFIFGSSPLLTKQSVKSTAITKKYDNSKSKDLLGIDYSDLDKTISKYAKIYLESRNK